MTVLSPFTTQSERAVRKWIDTLDEPTFFVGCNPQECIRKAWGFSGLQMSVGSLGDAMWNLGFKLEQVDPIPDPAGSDRTIPQFELRVSGGSNHAADKV